jgi:hypothetical protein
VQFIIIWTFIPNIDVDLKGILFLNSNKSGNLDANLIVLFILSIIVPCG